MSAQRFLATAPLGVHPAGRGAPGQTAWVSGTAGARVQVMVHDNGTIDRQRGVAEVTQPFEGVTCIRLVSTIKAALVVPAVTPEYAHSPQVPITVQWDSLTEGCPANSLKIWTFFDGGLTFRPAAQGFALVVP